jgi:hypothetical protein
MNRYPQSTIKFDELRGTSADWPIHSGIFSVFDDVAGVNSSTDQGGGKRRVVRNELVLAGCTSGVASISFAPWIS